MTLWYHTCPTTPEQRHGLRSTYRVNSKRGGPLSRPPQRHERRPGSHGRSRLPPEDALANESERRAPPSDEPDELRPVRSNSNHPAPPTPRPRRAARKRSRRLVRTTWTWLCAGSGEGGRSPPDGVGTQGVGVIGS